jgi:hypothetical protein
MHTTNVVNYSKFEKSSMNLIIYMQCTTQTKQSPNPQKKHQNVMVTHPPVKYIGVCPFIGKSQKSNP